MVFSLLRRALSRRALYGVNIRLHALSLHGLGILNNENDTASGQAYFLKRFAEIARGLKSPITIADVGANVGAFSSRVRELLPESRIFAFEPHPKTFSHLKAAASRGHFDAVNCGCGESRGTARIYDRTDGHTTEHASLYKAVIEEFHHTPSRSFEITLQTLDEFMVTNQVKKIHLLKIDTEGHEYAVLLGAQGMIANGQIDLVQFEFNALNVISRVFFSDFTRLLPAYDFYRMLPDGLIEIDRQPWRSELFGFQNIVAIRSDVAGLYAFH
jgi:FkbM family methyltransferase